jgi:3-deoxy-D-manno-octulosonate 8-phosphate phosphatase (KDO 8-P phosphatase)
MKPNLEKAAAIKLLALDVDGVLTDGRLFFDANGKEQKIFHARDGYGLRQAMRNGIEIAIISGRGCKAVVKRMQELGIHHVFLSQDDKITTLQTLTAKLGIESNQVAYVGDDLPDIKCMSLAGLAVAVADAHTDVRAMADWTTSLGGGMGAVREVCDLLISARNI